MSTVEATLTDRESKYGSWKINAGTAQRLKSAMRESPGWAKLEPHQRESLEMIATKVGRLLSGDPQNADSWHDISGYAGLSERELVPAPVAPATKSRK